MYRSTEALVVKEKGCKPSLEQVKIRDVRPHEVLVDIHAVGICHTDVSCMNNVIPISFPAVLGHEGAGAVVEVGSHVTHVSPGDKVLMSFNSCGTCKQCNVGFGCYCETYAAQNFGGRREDGSRPLEMSDGTSLFSNFFGQSSFAKRAVVSGRTVVRVEASTDLALFAPLGCGVQTGVGTVTNTLNVRANESLAVFGVGAVGLSAVMAGKMRAASPLVAVDISPERLAVAHKLGATHTILSDGSFDVVQKIQEICGGRGVERAVDCSGVPRVIEDMIRSLAARGKAASVGAPAPGVAAKVDVFTHIVKGSHYIGSCEGDCEPDKMIPYLIDQHRQGQFPLEEIVTVYKGGDYEKAFDDALRSKVIKAVLSWE